VETLGCKANQYDGQRLAEALMDLGCMPAAEGGEADLHIVNTCTVTHVTDRKCRKLIRQTVRSRPGARVFVTGCGAESAPGAFRRIPGVNGVFGRNQWPSMFQAIVGDAAAGTSSPRGDFGVGGLERRGRALLKIQEGCNSSCTYCIVPYVRGRERSRPLGDVLAEARRLAERGFRELVLTGIHLGRYGEDLPQGTELADAVAALVEVDGIERIRISSVLPSEISVRLLEAMRHPAVCPHLHLPLQSGDDDILRSMHRPYTSGQFLETVRRAGELLDGPAITTDVLVGFPGETDKQFERTLRLCEEIGFSRVHVFPFSPRNGTKAAGMKGRIEPSVARERCSAVRELARRLARTWARGFVGEAVRVLWEEQDESGDLVGYTDRYVRMSVPGADRYLGETSIAHCTQADGGTLRGRIVMPPETPL